MAKLNQVIAITNGKKSHLQSVLTKSYHNLQKAELFQGLSRTYASHDEEGETLPPESKLPQSSVGAEINSTLDALKDLMNCVYTQEEANCSARADIVVDGNIILEKVPVTYLLFLEKKLVDIHTFVSKLPTLPTDRAWKIDDNLGFYITDVSKTSRTKKVRKSHVAYPATDKHPAQVETFTEDIIVGDWSKVDYSTCIPATHKQDMINKVTKLQEAVKFAREEANSCQTIDKNADKFISYIFG